MGEKRNLSILMKLTARDRRALRNLETIILVKLRDHLHTISTDRRQYHRLLLYNLNQTDQS